MCIRDSNGILITKRTFKRVRWTVSTVDTLLHDGWSPYDRFTIIPFFPFFRRGKTRGLVDNAIGPQKALDKGISQAIHIINTTANSGWQVEQDQLTNMTAEQPEEFGSKTRLVIERKAGSAQLQKIQANAMPPGVEKLIDLAAYTLKDVTVPDAMRGTQGPEQSGIAIQSKQHAAQQGLAVPLDNLARTRNMLARWMDYAITKYYDSERVFMITKTDPRTGIEEHEPMPINQFDPATGMYFNDMTIGEYDIVISDQPMQVTFENSQFTQAMELRTAGVAIPDNVVIRHSNLSDKHEIIQQMDASNTPPADPLLEAKARLIDAQAEKTKAETVNKKVEAGFGAIQTAQTITAIPQTAALADVMLQSYGFEDANAGPIIPSASAPVAGAMPAQQGQPVDLDPSQVAAIQRQDPATARQVLGSRRNTNPLTPLNPATGIDAGIEGGA